MASSDTVVFKREPRTTSKESGKQIKPKPSTRSVTTKAYKVHESQEESAQDVDTSSNAMLEA